MSRSILHRARKARARARGWWRSRRPAPVLTATSQDLEDAETRLVWIFGSPRSGSTWLMRLLAHATDPAVATIDEPRAGDHLALLEARADGTVLKNSDYLQHPGYLLSDRYRGTWEPALRELLIRRFLAEAVDQGVQAGPVVIKEPNGSQGAELLARLLPKARILHLQRDPADILDSQLDAATHEIWGAALGKGATAGQRLDFLRANAELYKLRLKATEAAVERAGPRGMTVRYEDLLAAPAETLMSIIEWLGQAPSPERVAKAVTRHDFKAAPESERGPGHVMRAASPGLWRQNLSAAEQELIHELLGTVRARLNYP